MLRIALKLTSILAIAATLLSACTRAQVYEQEFLAFGTVISVTIVDTEPKRSARAFDAIQGRFDQMHHDWHTWHQSELTRINRALQAGGAVTTDNAELLDLIVQSAELSQLSGHRFNPFFGELFKTWGFHQDQFEELGPPSPSTLKSLLDNAPSADDLTIEDQLIRSRNRSIWIDLGGIAKGYAIDLVMDQLKGSGIHNAIVNAGGDLRAMGQHPERQWQIGVRDPSSDRILASIRVAGDEAIFTSGDYERFFEYQGQRFHHIINPETGYPTTGFRSVTVIHNNATVADAAATALMVAGPDDWAEVAQDMNVSEVLLVDYRGNITFSGTLIGRVEFLKAPSTEL